MASTILSDNGVSSGSAGIKTTGGNDGVLALQTTTAGGAATTAVTIDTSQRVGIGTASPTQLLTLSSGATPRISLKDTRASVEMQVLADNVAGYSGTVTNYPYIFVTNNAERMRIATNGNFLLGTTTSPSGAGAVMALSGPNNTGVEFNTPTAGGCAITNNAGTGVRFYNYTGAIGAETYTQVVTIDSAGRVTTPYQPAFRAIASASTNYSTGSTKITVYDTAVFNIGSHYSTSTQRFTAPVAGVYIFTARAWALQGNTTESGIQIVKNGVGVGTLRIGSSSNGYSTLQPMTYISLAVGDYVEVFTETASATGVIHTSAGEQNSMFAGYFLG